MLNQNLKEFRRQKGMSQEMLAMRLNVVRQTVSKWEKGLSVPDADMIIKIADILEVDVSSLLGAEVGNEKNESRIAESLARIAEELAVINRRSKRFWRISAGAALLILLTVLFVVVRAAFLRNTIKYGYLGSTALYEDVSCITDSEALEWIAACNENHQAYSILYSSCTEAEISEGYVSKFLIYVPGGFSSMDFQVNNGTGLFGSGKRIDFRIGAPFTAEQTYKLALVECRESDISEIALHNINGVSLSPVITKTRDYYVFGKYYVYFKRKDALMSISDKFAVNRLLNLMPLERFGSYEVSTQKDGVTVEFEEFLSFDDNDEMRHWGLMFLAAMKDGARLSWTYPETDGTTVENKITRTYLDSLFPEGYSCTWEEFRALCP